MPSLYTRRVFWIWKKKKNVLDKTIQKRLCAPAPQCLVCRPVEACFLNFLYVPDYVFLNFFFFFPSIFFPRVREHGQPLALPESRDCAGLLHLDTLG